MRIAVKLLFLVVMGMLVLTGCTGAKKGPKTIQDLNAPEWVLKGGGAFGGDSGKVFYGVGSAPKMKSMSTMMRTADNRARNDIAKVFKFYTASLMKDYSSFTQANDPAASDEMTHIEEAIKTVTSMTLSGVQVVDHWQHPNTMEMFSLARIDLETFKDNLAKAEQLTEKAKEYIKNNAEKMHDQLESEVQK